MKRKISVNSVLKLLDVSSSGYYDWKNRIPSPQQIRREEVKEKITEIHNESFQIYGAPKITSILNANDYVIAERTVSKYMKELSIKAIWVRPYTVTTIDPDFDVKLKNILNRQFNPTHPNAVWVTDITYIHTLNGFAYLTSIMDLYSRKIVGWSLSDNLSTDSVILAVKQAKRSRDIDKPLIIHSDRGVQFVSKDYKTHTPNDQFIHSYSRKGTPWDNACIESFHSLIKREWLNRYVIKDQRHAHQLVFEYIDTFYNTIRIHGSCKMMSPTDYELSNIS